MKNFNTKIEAMMSGLVSTKGTKNLVGSKSRSAEVISGKDSAAYYMDDVTINQVSSFKQYSINATDKFLDIRTEMLDDTDLIRESAVKMVDRSEYKAINASSIALPIDDSLVCQLGRIKNIALIQELKGHDVEFFLQNDRLIMKDGNQMIPLLTFIRDFNNIAVLYKNKQNYYFIDGFATITEGIPKKELYTNELFLTELLRIKSTGVAKLTNRVSSTVYREVSMKLSTRQLFNYFIYKTRAGFVNPANTYVTQIGGDTNRDSWIFDTTVLDKLQGQVCWLLDSDRASIETTEEVNELIFSNPCVSKSSASQGYNFKIMDTPEEAVHDDARFLEPKFNIDCTMLISMKQDKGYITKNLVFANIDHGSDNNCYGNSLWEEPYAGKIYACDIDNKPVRIKWASCKAFHDYKVTSATGDGIDNWVIAPAFENSNETYEFESKSGPIKQLMHMGYVPEPMTITFDGKAIETLGFRDIPFYIDPTTSSDYNVGKKFDTKMYSTFMSCVYADMEENGGRGEAFLNNIKQAFDQELASDIFNLAKIKVHKISLEEEM